MHDASPDAEQATRVKAQFDFAAMGIGDSFLVTGAHPTTVRVAASHYKRDHPGWNYATRRENNTIRLWRTA